MNDATTLAENSEETARRRGPGRRFPPGVSGNPGGRPRELADVKALAREHTEEAITTLVQLMREGKTDTARAAAASELLSRAWGKPSLPIQHETGIQIVMTSEQMASLEEALGVAANRRDNATTMSR